ncbi:MAG: DNA topoisomerase III [Lachnospiraceae bacterium]|nr:DNA topoisomerase III [Lachnospiraceae bacterium]
MKSLILAEKPSVARDIARVLNCRKTLPGAIEGNAYVVTWALGHLVTLSDPENYDKKFKEWDMSVLPMIPAKWDLIVIKQTAKQYSHVKSLLFRNDINEIIIATDAGREGELVARWILEKAGCRKAIKRLWISSVTDKAIKEGFQNLKDGRKYNALYHAARSRAEADWLVGINATRALTCKYNAQLSCGRVQTPTLAMISAREEEIRSFKPKEYYGLNIQASQVTWTWQDKKSGSTRSFSKDKLADIQKTLLASSNENAFQITDVQKAMKKTVSPGLYDLTELQRDANRRFGFSAKETLNIMQRLYETHKVLTYPRTDSRYIGSDVVPTLKERLKAINFGPYKAFVPTLLKMPLHTNKSFVDDRKVSDHHAIIPTEEFVQPEHMTNEERKIYDLVVRRFISVLYPAYEYEQTTLQGTSSGQVFKAKGNKILSLGWKALYENDNISPDTISDANAADCFGFSQKLPEFKKGQNLRIDRVTMTSGKTAPPARFTEATLLSAMENPIRFMESKDSLARKTLGETGGLGTVATRADIIEKLFHTFLIEKKGQEIHITSKGKQLLTLVPADLKKPELTASWEMQLSEIAKGKTKEQTFLHEIEDYTKTLIQEIKTADGTFKHDNLTNHKCPNCGKRLLAVNGKNARLLVCQDRACGYKETIARTSNARCPECHKRMELIKKGDTQIFVCSCGHKEKLDAFKERRKKEGAGVSKKDVQRYLNKQKEEPVNNAFAQALSGLKLDE